MKIRQRQDVEVKFKLKGKVVAGTVEIRSSKLEYQIKNGEYETIPVRAGNTIYIVPKELVVVVGEGDIKPEENNQIERQIDSQAIAKKIYEEKKLGQIRYALLAEGAKNLKNETLERLLLPCVLGHVLLPLAKKFRNNGTLKLKDKKEAK